MGSVANSIRVAEVKVAGLNEQLSTLEQAAVASPGQADIARLQTKLPTAKQESWRQGAKLLALGAVGAFGTGVALRALRALGERQQFKQLVKDLSSEGGESPRTRVLKLPVVKSGGWMAPAAIAALATPSLLSSAGSSVASATEQVGEAGGKAVRHLFSNTGSPWDNPWVMPLLVGVTAGSGALGYSVLDRMLERRREAAARRQIDRAKREFEDALRSQYQESELAEQAGVKLSSAQRFGRMLDALGTAHATGELAEQLATLDKRAQEQESALSQYTRGAGSKALGLYLTTLALLGAAGALGGYHMAKSFETPRQKYEIARDIVRRRVLAQQPAISVEPEYAA